jgi:hypothetical protein
MNQQFLKVFQSLVNTYISGRVYKEVLFRYARRDHWNNSLSNYMSGLHLTNTTNFNYETSFSYFIGEKNSHVASQDFEELSQQEDIHLILLKLSAIAPFAVVYFVKYPRGSREMISALSTFSEEHERIVPRVQAFLEAEGFTVLDEEILSMKVPGIALELHDNDATIYNLFFEE